MFNKIFEIFKTAIKYLACFGCFFYIFSFYNKYYSFYKKSFGQHKNFVFNIKIYIFIKNNIAMESIVLELRIGTGGDDSKDLIKDMAAMYIKAANINNISVIKEH